MGVRGFAAASLSPAELLREADRAMQQGEKWRCISLIQHVYEALDVQTRTAGFTELDDTETPLSRVAALVIAGWTLVLSVAEALPAFA